MQLQRARPLAEPGGEQVEALPPPAPSPLWMVTQEPQLTQLVGYLDEMRQRIEGAPQGTHELVFSRSAVEEVRLAFARMIRRGESKLHRLCSLFSETFFPGRYELESVVVAEVETTRERFVLSRRISPDQLTSVTDLDLANEQVERLRWYDGSAFRRARLVANFVEYQPFALNRHRIHKIGSRIKAEEEIWNKVVDEIFDLDGIVARDKKLKRLSRYVKDIFGLKIVVGDAKSVERVQSALAEVAWDAEFLLAHGVPPERPTSKLEILEVKDYLRTRERKASGWSAMKSVVRWWDCTFEIQVQPVRNYLRERERLTRESHAGFKARREELRDAIAREIPLFGFYRDLLQWLFRSPDAPPPEFPGVKVRLRS